MSNRGGARGSRGRQQRRGGTKREVPNGKGFRTDSDISGASAVAERKLEKWQDQGDSTGDVGSLNDDENVKWDQFEVNNRKFGVKGTYDEHIYTTAINKDHPEYEARARKAEQLAREIEGQTTDNVHLAEERGHKPEHEVDEETKYSGVDRSGSVHKQEQDNRSKDEKDFSDKHKKTKKFNFAASAAKATAFRPTQPQQPPPQFYMPSPYVDQYGQAVMMPYGFYPPSPYQ